MDKKKLVYLTPHLSTGGMPQFVLKRVQAMLSADEFEVYVIEFNKYSTDFVVQRNQIIQLLDDNFKEVGHLGEVSSHDRHEKTKSILLDIDPDIIHIDECPESFDGFNKMEPDFQKWLYTQRWKTVETCHNIVFDSNNKVVDPDGYAFCSPYHVDTFKNRVALKEVIQYPIEDNIPNTFTKSRNRAMLGFSMNKTHVLNVGLWTQGKNQKEGIEIARIAESLHPGKFHFHFVGNQASNFEGYWQPIMKDLPSNVTIHGEQANISSYMSAADAFMFNSTWECSPLALREAISHGLVTFARDLDVYKDMFTKYIQPFSDDSEKNASILISTLLDSEYKGNFQIPKDDFSKFTQQHIDFYNNLINTERAGSHMGPQKAIWNIEYADGPRFNMIACDDRDWRVEFWDAGQLEFKSGELKAGWWTQPLRKWWTNWQIKLYANNILQETVDWTLEGQEATVEFGSSSLGDTLSFMGQLHTMIDTHKLSKLYVKTHKSWLFDHEAYAKMNIHIIPLKEESHGAKFEVGVFYAEDDPWKRHEHKYDWRQIPLGKIASDRLGLEYLETKPILAREYYVGQDQPKLDQVVFATDSTARAKYWNNPTGWQDMITWWNQNGIRPLRSSKEEAVDIDTSTFEQLPEALESVAEAMNRSKYFIGISSGLSWLAWALDVPVVMISGFTDAYVEFEDKCIRIQNPQTCHGCWGWGVFDRGDWNWCPAWKDTPRHFECTKTITADMVKTKIESNGW
jgi:autotransporter strand-loop-strand O-heptosyltransferase|tara:strand:+ start:6593 stop:8809 length:2217 start_codon:yes stop_codon:yes gene_type:complete